MTQTIARTFFGQFLQAGDLAFDMGAFHGSRTQTFRALGARVVAVEPVKESVRALFVRFHDDAAVTIVPRALGAIEGRVEIVLSSPNLFSSSLSAEYRRAGVESDRYERYGVSSWRETRSIRMTTLDALIGAFGVPAFTKTDVEGYEHAVLNGLSQLLPALSFEFHPHLLEPALTSILRLSTLGEWRMNLAIEETFEWQLGEWVTPDRMIGILKRYRPRASVLYGDIYARLHTG